MGRRPSVGHLPVDAQPAFDLEAPEPQLGVNARLAFDGVPLFWAAQHPNWITSEDAGEAKSGAAEILRHRRHLQPGATRPLLSNSV